MPTPALCAPPLIGAVGLDAARGSRLNMYENACDKRDLLRYVFLNLMPKVVRTRNSHFGVDLNMEIDVILHSRFSGEALLDALDAWHFIRDLPDWLKHTGRGHRVGQLQRGVTGDAQSGDYDNDADRKRTISVGICKLVRVRNRKQERDDRRRCRQNIDRVVPRVSDERSAADRSSYAELRDCKPCFDHNRDHRSPDAANG